MATNYPGGLDGLSNPSGGDPLTSPSHAGQHANANDAIEAVQAELGTNPRGSASSVRSRLEGIENGSRISLPDGSIVPAQLARPIGNLLSDNQASGGDALGNTTGFVGWNCLLDYAGFIQGTLTGSTGAITLDHDQRVAVVPGETITVFITGENVTTDSLMATVSFEDDAGVSKGIVEVWPTSTAPLGVVSWGQKTVAVPAGATRAKPDLIGSGSPGDIFVAHRLGVWRGAGGDWAMPGVPIPHTGIRPNPANTSQVQVWNDATATWITV